MMNRFKKVNVRINGSSLAAMHKIIMEISLLIMEKSWNNHGILILNFCGNPDNMSLSQEDISSVF